MSIRTFIASDYPLPAVAPLQDYPLEINIDNGTIYDGNADDNKEAEKLNSNLKTNESTI